MIASLNGKITYADVKSVVIECSGVGLRCFCSLNTLAGLPKVGDNAFLFTHMSVKEDAIDLYGFATVEELEFFKLLTTVNGLGAKIAISILSDYTTQQIALFIAGGDVKALTKASGVGPKLAQRIVLELKDKIATNSYSADSDISAAVSASSNTASSEAVAALVALGFTQSDASVAVGKTDPSQSVDQIIKQALKLLSR